MPQILILLAAGAAGLIALRRLYKEEQKRIAAELEKARAAMQKRELDTVIPLVQDPATGVYRPKRG
jgi:hypothetical protein